MQQASASGYLEILPKGFGFLRQPNNSFQPSKSDIFVPNRLIRKYGLRDGLHVEGPVTRPKKRSRGPQLSEISAVEGSPPIDFSDHPDFSRLTSISPVERLRIDEGNDPSLRVIDLIAPIGKGQRALIVAPPRTGKTTLLQKLGLALNGTHPEVELIIALIDERPEEVTEMKRLGAGEVIHSSADQSAEQHTRVAEMILNRSRRLVEAGKDVVVLLDSITRLARAYNTQDRGSGRTLSGGLGAGTLIKPREFFGAARKVEEGGSLTIVATALIDTGSRMDDVIFEEFKGTGNMELVLDRGLADRRIWPAIDIPSSGTRREEQLRDERAQYGVNRLRRALASLSTEKAMTALLKKIEETPDNRAFLESIASA